MYWFTTLTFSSHDFLGQLTQNFPLPDTVSFSAQLDFYFSGLWMLFQCIWVIKILSRAAAHLLTFRIQLRANKHKHRETIKAWKYIYIYIYNVAENSKIPYGHPDHHWFPCKAPHSDKSTYLWGCPPQFSLWLYCLLGCGSDLSPWKKGNCFEIIFAFWTQLFIQCIFF